MALITEDQVVLDLTGADRHEATTLLAQQLVTSGRCTDIETFLADVRERESKMATGLPGGIGIPHARSEAITEPSLVFGRSTDGIDWGAKDGPANLVFLIAAPASGGEAHMQMLPKLARGDSNKVWIIPSELNDALKGLGQVTNAEEVRDYAASQGNVVPEAALARGMREKSEEFVAKGAQLYREE